MSIVLVIIGLIIFYLVLPTVGFLFIKNQKVLKISALAYLGLFLLLLITGVFSELHIGKVVTATFKTSGGWCDKSFDFTPYSHSFSDFVYNIAMLFPIGVAVAALSKKPLLWALIYGMIAGFAIEILQFVLPISRYPHLADSLLNGISSFFGGLYIFVLLKLKALILSKQKSKTNNKEDLEEKSYKQTQANTKNDTNKQPNKKENNRQQHLTKAK